jgi:hypothetical protein
VRNGNELRLPTWGMNEPEFCESTPTAHPALNLTWTTGPGYANLCT